MLTAAVIGTRELGHVQRMLCTNVVQTLVQMGFQTNTGAAVGADEVCMANSVGHCHVFLPWASYNASLVEKYTPVGVTVFDPARHKIWAESVDKYHPRPQALTSGARALHARNYGIVEKANVVVAFPNDGDGGGTMQGIRIAQALHIPLIRFKESQGMGGADLFIDTFIPLIQRIIRQ